MKRPQRIGSGKALTEEELQQQQVLAQKAVRVTLANPQEVKNRRGHKTDKGCLVAGALVPAWDELGPGLRMEWWITSLRTTRK